MWPYGYNAVVERLTAVSDHDNAVVVERWISEADAWRGLVAWHEACIQRKKEAQ